jgi:hypothetical protein
VNRRLFYSDLRFSRFITFGMFSNRPAKSRAFVFGVKRPQRGLRAGAVIPIPILRRGIQGRRGTITCSVSTRSHTRAGPPIHSKRDRRTRIRKDGVRIRCRLQLSFLRGRVSSRKFDSSYPTGHQRSRFFQPEAIPSQPPIPQAGDTAFGNKWQLVL